MAINREKVLEAAQKYVEKKKYDKAVQELQKLIEADPNDARTLLKIGDYQAKQGLHAEAISTYETVGKLYAHQGFALKAIAVSSRSARSSPSTSRSSRSGTATSRRSSPSSISSSG